MAEITNADILSFAQSAILPPTTVVVKTVDGGAVFIDPQYPDVVTQYSTGQLTTDDQPPTGIIAVIPPPSDAPVTPVSRSILIPPTPPDINPQPPIPVLTIPVITGSAPPSIPIPPPPSEPPISPPTAVLTTTYPIPLQQGIQININILPASPVFAPQDINTNFTLQIKPIPVPFQSAVIAASNALLSGKINSFFDQDRIAKTVLNFGSDFQALLTNWKTDTSSSNEIDVKLYKPLPPEFDIKSQAWIARELSPTYVDQIFVVFIPEEGTKLYLRPPDKSQVLAGINGSAVNNITLQSVLTTGSFSVTDLTDPVIERWYTTALEGAELNIDYADYSQFVFYSSARARLESFTQKLLQLENYNTVISQQSSSIASTNVEFTSSVAYPSFQNIQEQRIELIRSFDGYERFLYYDSGSAYSSSFSGDGGAVDQLYFLADATWPKINGQLISVASASNAALYSISANTLNPPGDFTGLISWLDAITYIAEAYDSWNVNRLSANIPTYLQNDDLSAEFVTFIDMIGHIFDVLKQYADHMKDIYDRNSNPKVGISEDLIWNVAQALGIDLPNQYAIKKLIDYTVGDLQKVTPTIYHDVAAETWKRFLHNNIYLLKTKGTKASLRGLLNTYGVLPTTIQVRESVTPSFYLTQSFETFEEQTNALNFQTASYLSIPYSGSGIPFAQTYQARFATTQVTSSILWNVDNLWGVQLTPLTGSYGHVSIISGSTTFLSSSDVPLFSGNYFNMTLEVVGETGQLWLIQTDNNGNIINYSGTTGSFVLGNNGSNLFLGSNGELNAGVPFNGTIDEFRIWAEQPSDYTVRLSAQYPALYNGNTTTSARDNLLVRLSFGIPKNLGSSSVANRNIANDSPYVRISGRSSQLNAFSASNFPNQTSYPYSMTVVTRDVLRYAPNIGGSQYANNKVVIEDPPVLRFLSDVSGSNIPVLSPVTSMVTLDQKLNKVRASNLVGFYFSLTDAINDSIIRSVGNINLQDFIGDPSDLYNSTYASLDALNELYWTDYAYTYNFNLFIEFVETLLQPLFTQAKDLVPARAKLLSGIVVESPILHRNKVQYNEIQFSGKNTRNPNITPNLESNAISAQPSVVEADSVAVDADIEITQNIPLSADSEDFDAEISVSDEETVSAIFEDFDADIDIDPNEIISANSLAIGEDESFRAFFNSLLTLFNTTDLSQLSGPSLTTFTQLLQTFDPSSTITISSATDFTVGDNTQPIIIGPLVDFDYVGSTTYFMQPFGIVKLPTTISQLVNQSILTNAGTWTLGSTYIKNQYVTQSNQTGDASAGNGSIFICKTPLASGSFVSVNPPSLDVDNWKQATFVQVNSFNLAVATLYSGSIELVSPVLGLTPFTGYDPRHYFFHHDNSAAAQNLIAGCVQTDETTPDGRPAVEIFQAGTGNTLIVNNGSPILPTAPVKGPILNVE